MKKYLFSIIFLLVSYLGFSQKGLSYQAVILDPNPIEAPGVDINGQPFINGDVWVKFSIYANSSMQFEEVHKTKTDAYGLVNLMIGSVSASSFNSLVWDSTQKTLQVHVSFDQGSTYIKVSDQKLTYNPYSLYAETASKLGGTLSISGGGTGATTVADARLNLGLDQVNNTSDAAKPVSTATKAALDLKANSTDVNAAIALKANTTDMTSALAAKVDSAFVLAKVAAAMIADADASTKGKIQLAGDLGGTAAAPTVPGLALKANAADVTAALALKANSSDVNSALAAKVDSAFVLAKVAAATIADADASTKGKIQLAGDLAGTAAAPTVPGLALKANTADVTAALALKANSSDVNSALAAKVDSAFVLTKVAAATIADADTSTKGKIQLAGDLGGTAAAPTVPGLALKANTTDVNTALALKAPLASPALSGIPTAPTASAGTSTTQIATTEYTNAAISSALSSTLFSISTTLTSTVTNPLGFEPTLDSISYSGPLNVSTAQNLANGVDVLKVNQSGIANVGFGLANLFSNTTGNANTSVGYKGLYSNTSGRGNSSFGYYSLFNNTTGNSNTANGGQSLFYNTTGGANTASGKFALFSNISANFNTATGYQALYANTTGGNNTATGATSLRSNTTGSSNTASGFGALFKNTTGSQNTANGEVALYSNTTGYSNTASGSFALYKNTTGANNMASGFFALFNNTQGSDNTASGKSALYSNTTGIENTAIGKNALITNTTGSNNTAIGSNADVAFNNLSNATAIGYSASVSTSNTIQLGNADVRNVKTSGTITAGAVTYPNLDGTNGQVLTSNGAGNASWISPTSVSVGTISSTSNANGATITSGVLNLTPADETNGGIITNGTQSFAGLKTFKDGINYIKVSSSSTLDQSNSSSITGSSLGRSFWQSFTAGISGILSSVEWEIEGPRTSITVKIYNGEGINGTLLGTANGMTSTTRSFVAFDLSSSNIKVIASQKYTIQVTTSLNNFSSINSSNPYADGRSSNDPNSDFLFKTNVKAFSTDSYLPLSGGALTGNLSTSGTLTAGTVTYPSAHGTDGQVLTTNGSGTLTWTTVAASGNSIISTLTSTSNNPLSLNNTSQSSLNLTTAENLANGPDVLKSNSSGIANVGFGIKNLYSTTSGSANTSVGFKGLYSNSTGSQNSSFGTYALYNNLADGNSAFGSLALISNTSGSNNTAIGSSALYSVTTGSNNTALGTFADVSSGDLTNATAIGYNAIVYNSNTIQLGDENVTNVNTSGAITVSGGTSSISGGLIVGAAHSSVSSAALEVQSTSKGFLPPRMTYDQRNAISASEAGLVVWCSNCGSKGELQVYNGTEWTNIIGGTASVPLVVGATYQGGKIAYILQDGDPGYDPNITHGIIAATSDQGPIKWNNGTNTATGATETDIGTGFSNTIAIITSQGATTTDYAAGLARAHNGGGYTDWYLPSIDELVKLYENRVAIGGFGSGGYWSSTEVDFELAWILDFFDSNEIRYDKANTCYVRAIRAF